NQRVSNRSIKANKRPANVPVAPPPQEPALAADPANDAARLGVELVHGEPGQQDRARDALCDGKGADYTDALAGAIHKLDGDERAQARDALAERLARMNAPTLRDKLTDSDMEIRRAAALACAMRDQRDMVPDMIALMEKEPASPIVPAL